MKIHGKVGQEEFVQSGGVARTIPKVNKRGPSFHRQRPSLGEAATSGCHKLRLTKALE